MVPDENVSSDAVSAAIAAGASQDKPASSPVETVRNTQVMQAPAERPVVNTMAIHQLTQASFFQEMVLPSPRQILFWFAEDPASFLTIGRLVMDLKSQETFKSAWSLCIAPAGEKLAPKLDKLFSLDESKKGTVGLFGEVSEEALVEHICKTAMQSIHGRPTIGIQGQSGLQINPDTVRRTLVFFTDVLLPVLMLFLNRTRK